MKKTMARQLCSVILVSMVLLALISYSLQLQSARENVETTSILRLNQIKQILTNNNEEVAKLKMSLEEDYFIRARAAAYIVQKHPESIGNQAELKKIAALLRVDELHIFDQEGEIYAGTEPKYFGFTFDSGEQLGFFRPMLEDTSLALYQDIRPNTAEEKLMQYIAVWREDHQGIVQIGMEPTRLLRALEKNELSHIFTLVTADKESTLFAANSRTGEILGSTDQAIIGKTMADLGIAQKLTRASINHKQWDIAPDGIESYCMIQSAGDVVVGIIVPYASVNQEIPDNMQRIVISLLVLSVAVVLLILRMLDRDIIQGLHRANRDMGKIAAGDLDYRVEVGHLPEFVALSSNINSMVGSLLETTEKLSLIFQNVNIPIAVYEYNTDMKRVMATKKIGEILGIAEEEMEKILSDQEVFVKQIDQACQCACVQEKDVYLLGGQDIRYVKIRSYQEHGKTLGILVDVTADMEEKQQIKRERDVDLLTDLLSRRAFFAEMDRLFKSPQDLATAALLMIDADYLKQVNDNWGHEAGDCLLATIAGLIKTCGSPNQLAARLSGDEFVVFLHHGESEDALLQQVESLYQTMCKTELIMSDQTAVPVRFSCGYVVYKPTDSDYQKTLKLADKTMYQAKKVRKGHFVRFEEQP